MINIDFLYKYYYHNNYFSLQCIGSGAHEGNFKQLIGYKMMNSEEIVKAAEAAYASQNIEKVAALFDPDVVVYWNGKKIMEGRDQVVEFERKNFSSWTDFKIKKTLRAASGDCIAVEFEISFIDKAGGESKTMYAGEFWKMRNDCLVEWRAYSE